MKYPNGHYLVVRQMDEAREVCEYIEGRGNRDAFLAKFSAAASPGFDPDVHLRRIGVANQTTMLAKESLAIGEEVGQAMARARGDDARLADFRTFDTICSATQERQDAVLALLDEPLDAMVVIGGFNSSNTISLAALCAERVPTYHIEDAAGLDPEAGTVHFRVAGVTHVEQTRDGWLPTGRPVRVGVTAGASTPNNKIGETVARILATRGLVYETA
jgi:4-hydroxy-3-methylbut-2-enyl diphosphate reductase